MNRERIAWMVSVALAAILCFQLPGSLAQRDDDYTFVRTLVDIHRQVATNYVEPVDEQNLRQGAIDGMLSELDPFSVFVPPNRQEDFDVAQLPYVAGARWVALRFLTEADRPPNGRGRGAVLYISFRAIMEPKKTAHARLEVLKVQRRTGIHLTNTLLAIKVLPRVRWQDSA